MMITDRQRILSKIKKCLALARSDNEHEAAAALRKAREMMEAHGVSAFDVEHADIREQGARAGAASRPARWECALAMRVARAFDCAVYLARDYPVGRWTFLGAEPSAEIACYAFEVLFRQIRRARAEYIKSALRRCKPSTRTRRADLYCDGWVAAATEVVDRFAGNAAAQARNEAYMRHKHDNLTEFHGRDRNADRKLGVRDCNDLTAGATEGRNAQLRHGVGSDAQRLALEQEGACVA